MTAGKQEEVNVDLPHTGLRARIVLVALGQQMPKDGDSMIVQGCVCLPCESTSADYIAMPLRFGKRVVVAGETLNSSWGYKTGMSDAAQMRRRHADFMDLAWSKASDRARTWANAELGKLTKALEERHQALVAAGDLAWVPEESRKPWKRILEVDPLLIFHPGDEVIYRNSRGDSLSGTILESKPQRVKISIRRSGKAVWVKPTRLRREDADH